MKLNRYSIIGAVLLVSLANCKDDKPVKPSAETPAEASVLSARAFCELVMGAPARELQSSCTPEGTTVDPSDQEQFRRVRAEAALKSRIWPRIDACEKLLRPGVENGRLELPAAVANKCGKAIFAQSWKETLTVRPVGWYLSYHPDCRGALVGKQPQGQPCALNLECQSGHQCQIKQNEPLGRCVSAPGKGAACRRPMYAGLSNEIERACAAGHFCNFDTVTEVADRKAKFKPGANVLSPCPTGAFLDKELEAPIAAKAFANMWGDSIGESFGAGGLGLSGIGGDSPDGGTGRGIGLGSIGTMSGSPGQGFGSGHGRLGSRHRSRPPRVRMGAVSVSGRLPPEVIQRIVRQNFGRFRLCYENGLRNNPELQGRVAIRFVIGRDGQVSNVGSGGDLPDQAVRACVARVFYGLTFPQPEGGIVTVSYPIVFTPGNGASKKGRTTAKSDPQAGKPDAGSPAADGGAAPEVSRIDGPKNVCLPLVAEGGGCWESWQCASGLNCLAGKCQKERFVKAGGACYKHSDCLAGHYCHGTCKPHKRAGDKCRAAIECRGACSSEGKCITLCSGK